MKYQSIRHICGVVISTAMAAQAFGFMTVIDTQNGPESDFVAAGRIIDSTNSSSVIASWSLTTTVSATDFVNDAVQVGMSGVQYTMLNETPASADSNMLRFRVFPTNTNHGGGIVVSQSPYLNATSWNGGNEEVAQFRLSWPGDSGLATVSDPDNQLAGIADGSKLTSGSIVTFSSDRIRNDNDTWRVMLPFQSTEAHVEWSSSNPSANSTLTREWVSFNANVGAVPEPATFGLLLFASLLGFGVIRRRSTN
ncbi:MAG: PEP-CTERM sorting domain-containing protein [Planctomycetota bacterium]